MTRYCRNMWECDNLWNNCAFVGHCTKKESVYVSVEYYWNVVHIGCTSNRRHWDNKPVIVTPWVCDGACFGHQLATNGLLGQNSVRIRGNLEWICVFCDFYGRFLPYCTRVNSGRRVGLVSRQVWPTRDANFAVCLSCLQNALCSVYVVWDPERCGVRVLVEEGCVHGTYFLL